MTAYTAKHPEYGSHSIIAANDRDALGKYVSLVRKAIEAKYGKPGHYVEIKAVMSDTGKTELWMEHGYSCEQKLRGRVTLKYAVRKATTLEPARITITDPDAPATDKQIALIRKLATRIGGGSIAERTDRALAGKFSKGEASRLIDDMLTER